MRVDGDRADPLRRGEMVEMPAERCLVDGEVSAERQEGGGDHPVRNEIAIAASSPPVVTASIAPAARRCHLGWICAERSDRPSLVA